jgi:hypothetical protein
MKNACFFLKNSTPKKDLVPILRAIVRKFGLPKMLDEYYIEFLLSYSGVIDINLNNKTIDLIVDEDEAISHFKSRVPRSLTGWAFKEQDGKISQLCLTISIDNYHIPVYDFMNFEFVLFQLINIGGLDLEDAHAFQIARTESDQRGLHMSILKEDFGSIYYIQNDVDEPLPFGHHKVANNFPELINSLKLCIATESEPYPLTVKEIGHCIGDQKLGS